MALARQIGQVKSWPPDLREEIFRDVMGRRFNAALTAQASGVLSGMPQASEQAGHLGLRFTPVHSDGDELTAGSVIAELRGDPFQLSRAENLVLGAVSKTSGVATMARRARKLAGGHFRVVCGGFKKMPSALKHALVQAVGNGGLERGLAGHPFVYLDKNYVRILGGIEQSLAAVAHLPGKVVLQVKGETRPIGDEAVAATRCGAAIIMVDTGSLEDLDLVGKALTETGLRPTVEIAFAGDIQMEHLGPLAAHDVDAVDIGYAILDAPCLPIRFDVTPEMGV